MIKKYLLLFCFLFLFTSINLFAQYSGPESVAYDSVQKRYLISNTTSGNILQRTQNGTVSTFVTGAASARGIVIYNNKLYVACNTIIKGYDHTSGSLIMNVTVTGSAFLNDLTVDNNGILYASDFNANKIYKISTVSQAFWVYVAATGSQPNGVYWDGPRNRLLFCCWGANAPIKSVNLSDSSVSTAVNTTFSNCDGITMDKNNNVYVSSWGSQSVFKYNVTLTSSPVVAASGLNNPADIFVNKLSDTLVVPNAGNSTVSFYFLNNPTSISSQGNLVTGFNLFQNYPNPFNPTTNIRFVIGSSSLISLSIYDITGREVKSIIDNKFYSTGSYTVSLNTDELKSGIYFYTLQAGSISETKKMILLK